MSQKPLRINQQFVLNYRFILGSGNPDLKNRVTDYDVIKPS